MVMRTVSLKLDEAAYQLIQQAANDLGMSPGQYCRYKAMQDARIADLEVKVDARAEEVVQRLDDLHKDALRKIAVWIVDSIKKGK